MKKKEVIPWSLEYHEFHGLLEWFFAFGVTSNPKALWKRRGEHRIIRCPHCATVVWVPPYTRKGSVRICPHCKKKFKYKPSF